MTQLKINTDSYKIGMNEIDGLEAALTLAVQPLVEILKDKIYWSQVVIKHAEYTSRDGFIAYSSNYGGIMITENLPKCEEHDFQWVEFGEWADDERCDDGECGECDYCNGSDEHLDAFIKFWFKFEGIDDNGTMKFYLVMSGGNNDAPYFRSIPTLFESEFTAKTLKQVESRGKKAVLNMIQKLEIK